MICGKTRIREADTKQNNLLENVLKFDTNKNFYLPNGSYSVSAIQDYFGYIIKKHKVTDNPPINKIENRNIKCK